MVSRKGEFGIEPGWKRLSRTGIGAANETVGIMALHHDGTGLLLADFAGIVVLRARSNDSGLTLLQFFRGCPAIPAGGLYHPEAKGGSS